MPVMVDPEHDIITVDDEEVGAPGEGLKEQQKVYFLLNKPKGILVTNSDPSNRKTVGELMTGIKERVFPVGRLDMDSRGALIMTNDGELANRLTHPRFGIEKTYIVEVDGRLGPGEIEKIKRGIWLGPHRGRGVGVPPMSDGPSRGHAEHGQDARATLNSEQGGDARATLNSEQGRDGRATRGAKTDRFHVKLIGRERGRTILEVRLSEAQNREIRRVMARIGHNVRDLNRVAIAGKVTIKGLDVGKFRRLTEGEIKWLLKASSPEFHAAQKNSTQAWYEAKEMEKERKRLAREAEVPAGDAARRGNARQEGPASQDGPKKEFRERPVRKGRKPFVPPSGRNAGKILGGDMRGRKRLEIERQASSDADGSEFDSPDFDSPKVPSPKRDLPPHPLGGSAHADE
jgi:23S rRNA pseudouridine2605 synthase